MDGPGRGILHPCMHVAWQGRAAPASTQQIRGTGLCARRRDEKICSGLPCTSSCCCRCAADALSLSRPPALRLSAASAPQKALCGIRIVTQKRPPHRTTGEREREWDRDGALSGRVAGAASGPTICELSSGLLFGGCGAQLHWWTPRHILPALG